MWDQRAHALDYLAYAYLQQGRDTAARRVVDEAAAAPAGYPAGSLTHEYAFAAIPARFALDRKSTRLNSSHDQISYAVFCLKKKKNSTDTVHAFCAQSRA